MNAKLYIRNLPSSTTEKDLHSLFARSGTVVLVDIVKDRLTGHSRGYGFIEMSNAAEAENAVAMFNGWSLDHSRLTVGTIRQRRARSSHRAPALRDLPGGRYIH